METCLQILRNFRTKALPSIPPRLKRKKELLRICVMKNMVNMRQGVEIGLCDV